MGHQVSRFQAARAACVLEPAAPPPRRARTPVCVRHGLGACVRVTVLQCHGVSLSGGRNARVGHRDGLQGLLLQLIDTVTSEDQDPGSRAGPGPRKGLSMPVLFKFLRLRLVRST